MNRYRKNSLTLKDAITIWDAIERRLINSAPTSIKIQEQFELLSKHIFETTGEGLSNTLLRDSLYYPIKNKVPVIKVSRRTMSILKKYVIESEIIELIDAIENSQIQETVDDFNGIWDCYRWSCINHNKIILKSILELNNTHNHTFEALLNDPVIGLSRGWGKLHLNAMTIVIENSKHPIMIMTDYHTVVNNEIVNQLSGIIVSSQGYGQLSTKIALYKIYENQKRIPEIITPSEEALSKLSETGINLPEDEFICNISVLDTPPYQNINNLS